MDPTLHPGSGSFDFVTAAQYALAPRPLGIDLTLSGSYQANTRNDFIGQGVPSTGGTIVYLTPGVRLDTTATVSLYAFVMLPVYRYVNETQLVPTASLVAGFSAALR